MFATCKGRLAIVVGLTRRTTVGEISQIQGHEADDTDWTVRIVQLSVWNQATWGDWEPLACPSKLRVMDATPITGPTDDRLFPLDEEEQLDVVVRTKSLAPAGFQCHALIVIVSGVFGKWLYIVGRFPGLPGYDGPGGKIHLNSGSWW